MVWRWLWTCPWFVVLDLSFVSLQHPRARCARCWRRSRVGCLADDLFTKIQNADVSDTYIEVVGRVVNSSTVQMLACINLGSDLGAQPYFSSPLQTVMISLRYEAREWYGRADTWSTVLRQDVPLSTKCSHCIMGKRLIHVYWTFFAFGRQHWQNPFSPFFQYTRLLLLGRDNKILSTLHHILLVTSPLITSHLRSTLRWYLNDLGDCMYDVFSHQILEGPATLKNQWFLVSAVLFY